MTSLAVFSAAGVVAQPAALRLALRRLRALGFDARLDDTALARSQRFAGDDAARLQALHRVADAAPSIALASRGGYGLARLLAGVDWRLLARSVERGTRWVGHSDITALQIGLWALHGAPSWAGPMAIDDFSRSDADGGVDEVTRDCFLEAMDGRLEAVGFRTDAGFDGLAARGVLWGGNLSLLQSLLGTRWWPGARRLRGGILFLEDVNEHPYRVERMLLQLHHAGVLAAQKAILLGAFTAFRPSSLDRGYGLKGAIAMLRSVCRTPILTGLPFGHVHPKVCLPLGRRVQLLVDGRNALIGW